MTEWNNKIQTCKLFLHFHDLKCLDAGCLYGKPMDVYNIAKKLITKEVLSHSDQHTAVQYYKGKSKFSIPGHPHNYNELHNGVNATYAVIGLDQARQ